MMDHTTVSMVKSIARRCNEAEAQVISTIAGTEHFEPHDRNQCLLTASRLLADAIADIDRILGLR